MSRVTWKFAGAVFPALVIFLTVDTRYPIRTCFFIGLSIIIANNVGYIEAASKKFKGASK